MERKDVELVARGLISGWLTDQVDDRGGVPLKIGVGVALFGLLGAVFTDGVLRALFVIVLLVGAVVATAVWIARWLAIRGIRWFGEPRGLRQHRGEIQAAIDEADLPTGPLAIARFLFRLRRGVSAEVDRVQGIVNELTETITSDDLDADEPHVRQPPPPTGSGLSG